jgi:gamma-glutamylcyclotransferase (GGCT)/AIG2-like uncharacterized protein YtfP
MSTAPEGPFRLFVYGTLMRGGCRHPTLAGQRFLGPARTVAVYDLLDLGAHPGLVRRHPGGRSVRGELYEVAAGLVPALDAVEEAPGLFRLGPVELETGPALAYFYVPDAAGLPRYPGDLWDNARGGGGAGP